MPLKAPEIWCCRDSEGRSSKKLLESASRDIVRDNQVPLCGPPRDDMVWRNPLTAEIDDGRQDEGLGREWRKPSLMIYSVLKHGDTGFWAAEGFEPRGCRRSVIALRTEENPVDGCRL